MHETSFGLIPEPQVSGLVSPAVARGLTESGVAQRIGTPGPPPFDPCREQSDGGSSGGSESEPRLARRETSSQHREHLVDVS